MSVIQQFNGVTDGSLTIRPLTGSEGDLAAMARWLSDPRVLEFYEGRDNPHDVERVRQVFLTEMAEKGQMACIVELDGTPIGYLQFYLVDCEELAELGLEPTPGVFGLDQFIGEPGLWGQGVGRRMIRLILGYLFDEEAADRVILDPVVTNLRAIRCYEACGFERIAVLPEHEMHEGKARDVQLMGVTRGTGRLVDGLDI